MNRLPRLALLLAAAPAVAQSYDDLTESRGGTRPYSAVTQVELGAIATIPDGKNANVGLDDEISWDGRVYHRNEAFGSRRGTLEAYAGRDGLFASFQDGKLVGDDTVTRFEFRARPWMFYRDGFYRGDDLVQNGFYDGDEYEGYVGFGREAKDGLLVEFGPFYKKLGFDRSDLTPPSGSFEIPEDYAAYGGRLYLEQNTLQMDRRRGMPRDGFLVTLIGEREWNDSSGTIGTSLFLTELPSAVWRVRGRLEWYVPSSDEATWEIFARGGWHDEKDRVQNAEGQRPLGSQWGDAQVRLRLHLGQDMTFTPFAQLQYSRVLRDDGFSSTKDFFFGAGAEAYVHFSDALSLHAWYSWVDNENRPSILIDEDVHGQQMFYVGMVVRFGLARS